MGLTLAPRPALRAMPPGHGWVSPSLIGSTEEESARWHRGEVDAERVTVLCAATDAAFAKLIEAVVLTANGYCCARPS